jgi:serine phosphatase RsbU (regulator of sigma subunit)
MTEHMGTSPAARRIYGLFAWGGTLRRNFWPSLAGMILAELLVLLPFALIDPTPYFGMPGALASAVSIAAAIALGAWAGVAVATIGGLFFVIAVADPAHPFKVAATLLTIVVWIVVALLAGLFAGRLRERLASAFSEVGTREEQLRVTLESADAAVGLFVGDELRCRNANGRLRRLFGSDQWVDQPLVELLPSLDDDVIASVRSCALGELSRMHHGEVTFPGDSRIYSLSGRCAYESEPMLFVTLTDVTPAATMRRSLEQLLDLPQQLNAGETPQDVADAVCRAALGLFGCAVVSFWSVQNDEIHLVSRAPRPATRTSWNLTQYPHLTDVLETRRPQFIYDAPTYYVSGTPSDELDELQRYILAEGFRSMMWLPVPFGARIGVVLFLGWLETVDFPSEETLSLFSRFADEASIAVERAERLEARSEVEALYRRLEDSLLPRVKIADPRIDFAFRYRAGEQRMHIGGDFLGAVEQAGGELALAIGDVSGHGPDAAAMGATLRASWRALALAGVPPLTMLRELDHVVQRDRFSEEEFATVCLCWISPDRRSLRAVLAGHHRPLLARADADGTRNVFELEVPYAPPLGVLDPSEEPDYSVAEMPLGRQWALLLYTDGLVEGLATPDSRERFGLRRLLPILSHRLDSDAGGTLDRILDEVETANGGAFPDDVALMLLQRGA